MLKIEGGIKRWIKSQLWVFLGWRRYGRFEKKNRDYPCLKYSQPWKMKYLSSNDIFLNQRLPLRKIISPFKNYFLTLRQENDVKINRLFFVESTYACFFLKIILRNLSYSSQKYSLFLYFSPLSGWTCEGTC